jgi:hypothetical protein
MRPLPTFLRVFRPTLPRVLSVSWHPGFDHLPTELGNHHHSESQRPNLPNMDTLSELASPSCPHCLTRGCFTSHGYRCDDCGSRVGNGIGTTSPARPGTPKAPQPA